MNGRGRKLPIYLIFHGEEMANLRSGQGGARRNNNTIRQQLNRAQRQGKNPWFCEDLPRDDNEHNSGNGGAAQEGDDNMFASETESEQDLPRDDYEQNSYSVNEGTAQEGDENMFASETI